MLRNPDNALPLYALVVIVGIMLGSAWRRFVTNLNSTGKVIQGITAGSAAQSGQVMTK